MPWNWELPDWPKFCYDAARILSKERQFLLKGGGALAFLKNINEAERNQFIVEILCSEGLESSKIEGEILDRESLQSSIRRQFGLPTPFKKESKKEAGMAKVLCDVYDTFEKPLTHEMLCRWHAMLLDGHSSIEDLGKYRTHAEPMQIVSSRYGNPTIFFEAPPSKKIPHEMQGFIDWFNTSGGSGSILERAAIGHLYFESIHPFEDGNGRIGRLLVEKILSQGIGRPLLIAVSNILEKRKKEYYAALEKCNRSLEAQHWVEFFTDVILQAQEESIHLVQFLIEKSKMFTALTGQINPRQEKALRRLFAEGPKGFQGGLSAENYMAITKASRATATRDLADLVEKGALVKTGELRYTRYSLHLQKGARGI